MRQIFWRVGSWAMAPQLSMKFSEVYWRVGQGDCAMLCVFEDVPGMDGEKVNRGGA